MMKLLSLFILAALIVESHQQKGNGRRKQCWTKWFNIDRPSGKGDYETLAELRKRFPGKICTKPLDIEVTTHDGICVSSTEDVIFKKDTTTGFICRNKDQPRRRRCKDYRVRFLCPAFFCNGGGCWTEWFDRDNPSANGDFETLADLYKEKPGKICANPFAIEVTTLSGVNVAAAGNVIKTVDTTTGFICLNKDQPKGKSCKDFRVRFLCPVAFCSGVCWTKWYDRDDPTGTGDWELLKDLRKKHPKQVCRHPLLIEAATVKGKMIPAGATGQSFFIYNPTQGFVCRNKDQKSGKCADYKVRFGCPLTFCNGGCWTDWFNRDKPNGQGEFETLTDLLKEKPGKVCNNPSAIEAQTLSGVDASVAGNVINKFDTSSGLICLNKDQSHGKICKDYRVRFLCPALFCGGGCWTDWFDNDNPDAKGDFETLVELHKKKPGKICDNPLAIEAQTLSGVNVAAAGNVIKTFDTTTGFVCLNKDQPKGKSCKDFRVRFLCPPSFCKRVCWTKWYDRDNPTGTGDWELLKDLRKKHSKDICAHPLFIEAATVKGKMIPAGATGQIFFVYSPTKGFACRNKDQKSKKCIDYKVRFGCPCPPH